MHVWRGIGQLPDVIHRPQFGYPSGGKRFRGLMEGLVLFPEDAIKTEIKGSEIIPNDKYSLEEEVLNQQGVEARRAVWEKWVDQYFTLPHTAHKVEYGYKYLGLPSGHLQKLFTTPPKNREEAIEQLTLAFDPQHFRALDNILKEPIERLHPDLAQSDNLEKMRWLFENSTAIRADIAQGVQHAIAFGFADAFHARIQREFDKVKKLEAIARTLGQLTLMTEYAPETQP